MLWNFFRKQKELKKKKDLIKVIILSLNIPEAQKELYLEAIDIVEENYIDNLYSDLIYFSEKIEFNNFEEINKTHFSQIAWMKKKEALEKQKEINAFNFLLHNI